MKIEEIYSGGVVGTTYLFLQSPALALAVWSFKLNKDFFSATEAKGGTGEYYGEGNKLIQHQKGGILGAGVCLLGKFAGWVIIFQLLLSTILLYTVNTKKPQYKDTLFGVAIANGILLGCLMIPATIMNPPLSIRTIPFYVLQIGIIIYLTSVYFLLKKIEKIQSTTQADNFDNKKSEK